MLFLFLCTFFVHHQQQQQQFLIRYHSQIVALLVFDTNIKCILLEKSFDEIHRVGQKQNTEQKKAKQEKKRIVKRYISILDFTLSRSLIFLFLFLPSLKLYTNSTYQCLLSWYFMRFRCSGFYYSKDNICVSRFDTVAQKNIKINKNKNRNVANRKCLHSLRKVCGIYLLIFFFFVSVLSHSIFNRVCCECTDGRVIQPHFG